MIRLRPRCDAGRAREASPFTRLSVLVLVGLGATTACSKVRRLEAECEAGRGDACVALGDRYRSGDGVPQDPARGFALHEAGCTAGQYGGCYTVAGMLRRGEGVTRDAAKAVHLFESQCLEREGRELSCIQAAGAFESGGEVPKDERRALECYRRGCSSIYRGLCAHAAEMAEKGIGTAPDPRSAAEYFLRSCDPSFPPRTKPPDMQCKELERARAIYKSQCAKGEPAACAAEEALTRGTWPPA